MKILTKKISCGEYEFEIATSRTIAVKAMEHNTDLFDKLLNKETQEVAKKVENQNEEVVQDLLKKKKLSELFEIQDQIGEVVAFVFPDMLKLAQTELNSQELLDYMTDNGVIEQFNNAVMPFIIQGFTQREQDKPKVKFSMI